VTGEGEGEALEPEEREAVKEAVGLLLPKLSGPKALSPKHRATLERTLLEELAPFAPETPRYAVCEPSAAARSTVTVTVLVESEDKSAKTFVTGL